jgi:hypothetical protein
MSEVSELVRRRGRAGRHRVSLASTPPSSATSATSTWASQSTRCAAAVSAVAQRATAFLAGRRGPTTSSSSSSRGGIGSSAAAPAPLALVAASGTAAAAAAARCVGGLAAVPQPAEPTLGAPADDAKAAARRRSAGRRPRGVGADAAPACGRAPCSHRAARGPRVPNGPCACTSYHFVCRLGDGIQVHVSSTPPAGNRVGRPSTNISCG